MLGTVYEKMLWREMTDLKVSEAGAERKRKQRREVEGREKPDPGRPCEGVSDLYFKRSRNH